MKSFVIQKNGITKLYYVKAHTRLAMIKISSSKNLELGSQYSLANQTNWRTCTKVGNKTIWRTCTKYNGN